MRNEFDVLYTYHFVPIQLYCAGVLNTPAITVFIYYIFILYKILLSHAGSGVSKLKYFYNWSYTNVSAFCDKNKNI